MTLSSILSAGRYASLTSPFSLVFLAAFLPMSLLIYSLTPAKWKKYSLLLASYGFFWLISGKLLFFLIVTTFSMHYCGLWLDRIQCRLKETLKTAEKDDRKQMKAEFIRKQRLVVFLAVVIHIGALLVYKYSAFFGCNINTLFAWMKIPVQLAIPKYIMPIGISFFSLQAVSYIMDVYHGLVKADENLFRLGLFISFFPQIVEGPICRYSQTAEQLWNVKRIRYTNLSFGAQRILYGMMKKIVIADRLDPFVKNIFAKYQHFDGGILFLAAMLYTVPLYMDFSGSMDAVIGTAQIFGVELPENFQRPFFSKTISEFWKRWHITLGTWFKDYVFYPVTTAKRMKKLTSSARKKLGNHYGPLLAGGIALFCVWLCNGLWHGAGWNFIFFGMYHFLLILGGNIYSPLAQKFNKRCHINPECFAFRLFQMLRTTFLVIIGEMFFRAQGLAAGFTIFGKIFTQFSLKGITEPTLVSLGIDRYDLYIVAFTVLLVLAVSILNEKGISLRDTVAKQNIAVRWILFYALILYIVIFGAYGFGYVAVDPMYAKF